MPNGRADKFFLSDLGEVDVPHDPDAWLALVGAIATRMLQVLPTEQDHWWFLVEQFDRSRTFRNEARGIVDGMPIRLHEVEFDGRRSEHSYVGTPNPGVVFLQRAERNLSSHFDAKLAEIVIANVYFSYVTACKETLSLLRLKYAVHFHNNCVKNHSFGFADAWNEVIEDLRMS